MITMAQSEAFQACLFYTDATLALLVRTQSNEDYYRRQHFCYWLMRMGSCQIYHFGKVKISYKALYRNKCFRSLSAEVLSC